MTIDDSEIFFEGLVNEELALAWLLTKEIIHLNHKGGTTCIYVTASDVFVWGCSDSEGILNNDWEEPSEIIDLYRLAKEDEKWGYVKWLCYKRNEQPQKPIKEDMIKSGSWNEKLEALPENRYWKMLADRQKEKK